MLEDEELDEELLLELDDELEEELEGLPEELLELEEVLPLEEDEELLLELEEELDGLPEELVELDDELLELETGGLSSVAPPQAVRAPARMATALRVLIDRLGNLR